VAAFGELKQIQNGGRCHDNKGAKNVKFTPNFTFFWHLCFLSHPHLVEPDKLNKSESVGQTLPQLPWK
jgi:hypothetical protein